MGLFEVASVQHGVVTRAQPREQLVTDAQLAAMRRSGVLDRPHAGILRVVGAPRTWEQRIAIALLAAGKEAAVSHATAAVLLGLEGFARSRIEISVPHDRRPRSNAGVLHRPRTVSSILVAGFPVTPVEVVLRDLAPRLGPERLIRVTDEAVRKRLTSVGKLRAFLADDRRGEDGVALMRSAMDVIGPDDGTRESGLEDAFLAIVRRSRLPRLVAQFAVHAGRTKIGTVDFALPEACIAVELCGDTYHRGLRKDRDAQLANRLALAGWLLLTYTDRQVRSGPDGIRDELETAVSRRAPQLLAKLGSTRAR